MASGYNGCLQASRLGLSLLALGFRAGFFPSLLFVIPETECLSFVSVLHSFMLTLMPFKLEYVHA